MLSAAVRLFPCFFSPGIITRTALPSFVRSLARSLSREPRFLRAPSEKDNDKHLSRARIYSTGIFQFSSACRSSVQVIKGSRVSAGKSWNIARLRS